MDCDILISFLVELSARNPRLCCIMIIIITLSVCYTITINAITNATIYIDAKDRIFFYQGGNVTFGNI